MEGVPVRLSDRCRLKLVEPLPQHVTQHSSQAKQIAENAHYDFSLENTVLRRLDEWREARTNDRNERDERLRLTEEAKHRAAEAAANLQRLNLAELTYPSTEDINDEPTTPTTPTKSPIPTDEPEPTTSDGILQPTPVNVPQTRINLIDDLDPIAKYNIKTNRFQHMNGLHKKNVDKMTFSDFENDTSSPFDNLELKSINDLELLAQVLNTHQSTNTSVNTIEENTASYPATTTATNSTFSPVAQFGYQPNPYSNLIGYGYYAPSYAYTTTYQPFYNNYSTAYPQYGEVPSETISVPLNDGGVDATTGQTLLKSRSKSVPDIVKELDEEVAEARLKARERSHNCSPAPSRQVKLEASSSVLEKLSDPYDSLTPKLQAVCKSIEGMGFPLDRVARACGDIGDDDKKIIEYLLIMGQLMDLGFAESKVAKALLQHNCNRDKALDELIS